MTAEVAVLNSTGVALAADSAVTIGDGKTYNSALKLFALSKTEPVGIMVYGNVALMDVPWETIIKVYRKDLGAIAYDTLPEYSASFIEFLEKRSGFFPPQAQESWFRSSVVGYFQGMRTAVQKTVRDKIGKQSEVNSHETESLLADVIRRFHADLLARESLVGMTRAVESEIQKQYSTRIKECRDSVFENLRLSQDMIRMLNEIAAMLHSRDIFSESHSGIVIAGFGSKDLFPSVETNLIDGIACNRVKRKRMEEKSPSILGRGSCALVAFAQQDVVASFMHGLDPSLDAFVARYLQSIFDRLPKLLEPDLLQGSSKQKQQAIDRYSGAVQSLLDKFGDELKGYVQRMHVQPIMDMVQALPKEELAAMAETLVNLTAFKRKMTMDVETVGGPIDVAVISKGDGLVWVKRKLYFPKELNHHFFANYHRGG